MSRRKAAAKKQEEKLDRAGCDVDRARTAEKKGERKKETSQASPFFDRQRKGQDAPVRRIETVNPCIPKAMQQKCHKQHSRAGDQVKEVHMSTLHSFAGYLTIQIETVPSDKRLCPHYFKKKNRLILSGARRFFYWSLCQRYNTHTHKKDDRKKIVFRHMGPSPFRGPHLTAYRLQWHRLYHIIK